MNDGNIIPLSKPVTSDPFEAILKKVFNND